MILYHVAGTKSALCFWRIDEVKVVYMWELEQNNPYITVEVNGRPLGAAIEDLHLTHQSASVAMAMRLSNEEILNPNPRVIRETRTRMGL